MEFTQTVTSRILENLEGEEKEEHLETMRFNLDPPGLLDASSLISRQPQKPPDISFRRVMLDYVKMETEYNCSKDVLAKLKKGLEVEGVGEVFPSVVTYYFRQRTLPWTGM